MKKIPKKSIVITLTMFLILGSMFCCCLGITAPFAQASNSDATHIGSHCHSQDDSDSANSTETESCECHYSNAVLANLNLDFVNPEETLAKLFNEPFQINVSFKSTQNDDSLFSMHSSVLRYKRGVPLYLENSILRI